MITVTLINDRTAIRRLTLTGHAESAPYGKDLVCAGVSSIIVGGVNALEELSNNSINCIVDEGYVKIEILDQSEICQIILRTLIRQLITVAEANPEYVKIIRRKEKC